MRSAFAGYLKWQVLRHGSLGGLTAARIELGRNIMTDKSVSEVWPVHPRRPSDRFFEASTSLLRWTIRIGDRYVGRPCRSAASPLRWPWPNDEAWVEAPTVLLQSFPDVGSRFLVILLVIRPMSLKECGDLRKDCGAALVPSMWRWNAGQSPPLRMLLEGVLARLDYLKAYVGWSAPLECEASESKINDLGRARPPWLGLSPQSDQVEQRLYFGWQWGAEEVEDTVVATKADSAGVDLALWAIGGDEEGMEQHRHVLRNMLLRRWKRRVMAEGCGYIVKSLL